MGTSVAQNIEIWTPKWELTQQNRSSSELEPTEMATNYEKIGTKRDFSEEVGSTCMIDATIPRLVLSMTGS